jgi:hypothetical protein
VLASDAIAGGYTTQVGKYTKIGNVVNVSFNVQMSSIGSFAGAVVKPYAYRTVGTDRSNTMALEKVVTEDKIEIVGEFKAVQVRTCTKVLEDGVELSAGYHRHVITAGQDYSGESAEYKRFVQRFTRQKSSQPLKHHKQETHHDNNVGVQPA